ncbi:MAG: hypothetical protein NZM37_05205 [Sandaracinaceae bacterium]|nr:hypothetical protein [Sandaracinaceae bacterium]MDW8245927.1 hypothetical protein [Sandaracinaceae bacterium]
MSDSRANWKITFRYHPLYDIVEASFENCILQSIEDVHAWEKEVSTRLGAFGKRVDLLIDLSGLVVKAKAGPAFGQARARVLKRFVNHSTRYHGDPTTKTAVLTSAVLHHIDANIYESREAALQALLRLKKEDEAKKGTTSSGS